MTTSKAKEFCNKCKRWLTLTKKLSNTDNEVVLCSSASEVHIFKDLEKLSVALNAPTYTILTDRETKLAMTYDDITYFQLLGWRE